MKKNLVALLILLVLPLLTEPGAAQRLSSEIWRSEGTGLYDDLGKSVAGAGDVDGDGVSDVIVGAPGTDAGGKEHAGSAYVYSGKNGTLLWRFDGAEKLDQLGWSVAGAGDVDRDGFSDLIVGSPYASPRGQFFAGSAYVYSGKNGAKLWQFDGAMGADPLVDDTEDYFGIAVAGAGDVNKDGFPDLIGGAHYADPGGRDRAGSAYVYSGKDGTLLWQFDGEAEEDGLLAVAGAGDVNQDGFADLIVGASNAAPGGTHGAGSAYVYSGKDGTLLWQFDGAAVSESLGRSVAGAGDVNRDGFPDLIVGAIRADFGAGSNAGSAYVFSGKDGSKLWQFDGWRRLDWKGFSVAGVGDVDQDGVPDVVVGAPNADVGGVDGAGTAYVYSSLVAGASVAYGTGLPGSNRATPLIRTGREAPETGKSFSIEVLAALGGSPCLIAGSLVRWEQPTPLGVTLYGDFLTPGAFALWILKTSGPHLVHGVGTANLQIRVPNDPTLVGFKTYWQAFVADLGSQSPIGISHTGGLAVTVVR